ncbi:MAG: hypothetical protein A2939_02455 [Parcubacteria group bacterium RIFCSPLOWO2_01_FULL_48_18]|nr:MAG: hypothetical protein A2939_02455 [Parcubacteria group bacterium RIFCSPLOWO2_01_FULL_48_18]OHB24091.1 MAG: hypothetical protein A3J67_01380 [Parcubacteria group bacterium RIFCSPHIGHO2_02_FULL_48_10b]
MNKEFHRENEQLPSLLRAEVVLDKQKFGQPLAEGIERKARNGFAFFAKRRDEKSGKERWEFITVRIGDAPILYTVNDKQYRNFSKREIVAVPADFIWNLEEKIWTVSWKEDPPGDILDETREKTDGP